MAARDAVVIYVVTRHPLDLPHVPYVVRPQYISRGRRWWGSIACLCPTLALARAGLQAVAWARFERDPADDPVIVETWLG